MAKINAMILGLLVILVIVGLGIYAVYDVKTSNNPFSLIFLVTILIIIILATIIGIFSHFFPNSKITKLLKKLGDLIQDGLQGL